MSGEKDVANLFNRVTALEQDDADADQTITRIIKQYQTVGIQIKIKTYVHQYRICGDDQPLYNATVATDRFL